MQWHQMMLPAEQEQSLRRNVAMRSHPACLSSSSSTIPFHSYLPQALYFFFPPQEISPPYSDLTCLSLLSRGLKRVSSPDFLQVTKFSLPTLQLLLLECGRHHFANIWPLPQKDNFALNKENGWHKHCLPIPLCALFFGGCSDAKSLARGPNIGDGCNSLVARLAARMLLSLSFRFIIKLKGLFVCFLGTRTQADLVPLHTLNHRNRIHHHDIC